MAKDMPRQITGSLEAKIKEAVEQQITRAAQIRTEPRHRSTSENCSSVSLLQKVEGLDQDFKMSVREGFQGLHVETSRFQTELREDYSAMEQREDHRSSTILRRLDELTAELQPRNSRSERMPLTASNTSDFMNALELLFASFNSLRGNLASATQALLLVKRNKPVLRRCLRLILAMSLLSPW